MKYPLADYALTPDVAIVDPQFVMSVPASVTADTGMDVLTHAIESYVSVMASDYTRGLSLQAIKLVFDYLEKISKTPDMESREKCTTLLQWLVWRLLTHSRYLSLSRT